MRGSTPLTLTVLVALLTLGLGGCGFKLVKQSDLDKMATSQGGPARPATPTPEPLRNVQTSHVNVELGEQQSGVVQIGEAGRDYRDVPRFPGSVQTLLHETAAGGGNSPRQADAMSYQTKASLARVDTFYATVLPAKGWRLVPGSARKGESLRAATYRKKNEQLSLEMSGLLHSMVHTQGSEPTAVTVVNITLTGTSTAAR